MATNVPPRSAVPPPVNAPVYLRNVDSLAEARDYACGGFAAAYDGSSSFAGYSDAPTYESKEAWAEAISHYYLAYAASLSSDVPLSSVKAHLEAGNEASTRAAELEHEPAEAPPAHQMFSDVPPASITRTIAPAPRAPARKPPAPTQMAIAPRVPKLETNIVFDDGATISVPRRSPPFDDPLVPEKKSSIVWLIAGAAVAVLAALS